MRYLDFSHLLYWGAVREESEKGKLLDFFVVLVIQLRKKKTLLILLLSAIWSELRSALQKDWHFFSSLFCSLKPVWTKWLPPGELGRVFQTTYMFAFTKQTEFRQGRRNRGVLRKGKRAKKLFPQHHSPAIFFIEMAKKMSLFPVLHADVWLSYSFKWLYFPVTFESFPTVPEVFAAHML